MADALKAFDIPVNVTTTSRRLLEEGKDGYPSWLSAADRKLLAANNAQIVPNAVVAKDGSGRFRTIAAALAAYPKNNKGRYTIYVKAGVYDEYITVTKDQVNVFMYGDGPRKTIVTGRKCNTQGIGTMQTASFAAVGAGFIAKAMGFTNTAGPEDTRQWHSEASPICPPSTTAELTDTKTACTCKPIANSTAIVSSLAPLTSSLEMRLQ